MPSNKNTRKTPPVAVEIKKEKDASPPVAAPEPDGPKTTQGAGKGKRVMGAPPRSRRGTGETPDPAELATAAHVIPPVPVEGANGTDVKMEDGMEKNNVFPLAIGTDIDCRWRDNQFYRARVIERRQLPGSEQFEYYMHYLKFNRRMDEWVREEQLVAETAEPPEVDADGKQKKRKTEEPHDEEHAEFDAKALREHEEYTKVKNVERIELGKYEMDTWYFSPLPAEYKDCKKLYFCEFDLQFFKRREQMLRHLKKTGLQHPPGDEIYRNGPVSMFEVDGKKEKIYCQNLCYLAKLFLDHKTLYYDVDLFLFYVLCECDERGAHIVGYFSKEKCSEEGYNLACILTLPPYQRKGYGKFLIAMSYELSKIECKVGTPERPLSDLGNVSYRGYWTRELLKVLVERQGGDKISIKELADITAIKTEDVISTLQYLNLIQYDRGQHVIVAAPTIIADILKKAGSPGLQVDPSKIVWTPYNAEREYANYRN